MYLNQITFAVSNVKMTKPNNITDPTPGAVKGDLDIQDIAANPL